MEKVYYLYVKISPLGLKYLGKTIKNPFTYMGSGKVWKRHLLKHRFLIKDIKTEILFETNNELELIKKGKEYSEIFNVVESNEWANLREENGDGGDTSNHIDYNREIFHNPDRSKHLNTFSCEEEKKRIIFERTSKIDYKNTERLKKIKENTNWESWKNSIKNRKIDYSKFLDNIHETNKKPILQLDLYGNLINEFDSALDASKKLGVNVSNIRHCLTNRNKTAFSFKWKYKN